MNDLREQLRPILQGRVCLIGVGQADAGDDGFGVRLAEALAGPGGARLEQEQFVVRASARPWNMGQVQRSLGSLKAGLQTARITENRDCEVIVAGLSPELYLGQLAEGGFDHAMFLDAVELGAAPGSVTLLDSAAMTSALPQVSTHRLSLGLLARLIEGGGRTKAWLLGVQPESLARRGGLSPTVQASLEVLVALLLDVVAMEEATC
jgi:hydrogenase maturation protease